MVHGPESLIATLKSPPMGQSSGETLFVEGMALGVFLAMILVFVFDLLGARAAKRGRCPYCKPEEMGASVGNKIVERWKLLEILKEKRSAGKQIAFTNGCFDILHAGHALSLSFAREQGDLLVVGLNSDKSIRSIKGPLRPILPEADRAQLLSALESVSYVVLFDEDTPALLIHDVMPDVLVKGEDYIGKVVVGSEDAGRVVFSPLIGGISTSEIIRRIKEGG
jgi:D-beta-D-heptose 7-phosphate kinase / D-beta-D-heptose 1-phosphate adenosyltransferase